MKYQTKLFDRLEILACHTTQELQTKLMEYARLYTFIDIQYATHRQEQSANWYTALVILKNNPKSKSKKS